MTPSSYCRLQAVPTADVADLPLVAEGLGVLGIAAGGLFGALWNLEKQNGAKLQQELQHVQQQVQELQQQVTQAQQQVEQEKQVGAVAEHKGWCKLKLSQESSMLPNSAGSCRAHTSS